MIGTAALLVVLTGAAWLALVALVCLARPHRAREGLASMGSNWRWQLGEHVPRAIVGLAMVLRAPLAKAPHLLEIGGWFLVASSILILAVPMRWHNRYAVWWAERIPLAAYRLLALPTLAMAVLLAYITL
ncbi:hypothetical protein LY632_03895 [Erythrobacter sp. SDW2]|uniref:hypothetical protein n=1 Tax=Erythrobacter sp. SDW2 TaxID=2907154 RepID=UPI001F41F90D|nr:hypothetical protein [Erythrobacter sp. SDW2]UIP07552.1 hypothetical protein LY632_03895 [Erythrobacter sp. SDW2]